MEKSEILDKVQDIIVANFDIKKDQVTPDLNLKNDLNADSIDFVEVVLELEDTFGAEVSDEDAEKLQTIGEIVDYIAEHQTA